MVRFWPKIRLSRAERLWAKAGRARRRRAREMPDERAAVATMRRAYYRLIELGWRPALYCPKDGTPFDGLEAGGGVATCWYEGEWPSGGIWSSDGDESWPAEPVLWRPRDLGAGR